MFLPGLLIMSHNTSVAQNSRDPFTIPLLFAERNNSIQSKYLALYKYYAQLNTNSSNQVLPVKQQLDSIISIPADSLITSRKTSFTFNMNGLQTAKIESDWNTAAHKWFNIYKTEWGYDAKRNNINYFTYYGDGDDINWYPETKFENTFDQNNRLVKTEGYGWNTDDNKWDIGLKVENIYDAGGFLITQIHSEWDIANNIWVPSSKFEFEYTSDRVSTAIKYEWKNAWVNLNKGEFTYYVFGKELSYTYYTWDGFSEWTNSYKSETQYNGNLQLTNYTEYNWDLISVIFVNFRKAEYKYDSENNMHQCVFSKWVKQLQGFILEAKEDCLYENAYVYNDLLLSPDLKFSRTNTRVSDNEIYFNHMLNKCSYFLHDGSKYVPNDSKTFYYSPKTVTKTDNQIRSDCFITPNPAGSYFTIEMNGPATSSYFTLYDLNGNIKISQKINNNESISTEFLSKGMYVYKVLNSENKIRSGKIIVN
jgi:hypothetical protein